MKIIVSERIKELMKEENLTQVALAEKAGVKPGKISESEEIKAGFIIRTGLVEINCTPEKLIAQKRESLLPAVTAVLFG